jgi:hypothetical protein
MAHHVQLEIKTGIHDFWRRRGGRGRGRSKPNRSGRLTEAGTGRAGVKDKARAQVISPPDSTLDRGGGLPR